MKPNLPSPPESSGDFRYAAAESKVPWHAVGEFYHAEDVGEVVQFLIPDPHDNNGYAQALEEVEAAIKKLQAVGGTATKLTLGKNVQEAERLICEKLGSRYCCLTANWTGGMEIAYKLAGLQPGDEVIMPAITFVATMAYPLSIGAKIVFADVDPETANLDPRDVERKITSKTRMIVPVHIGGTPCDMDPLMELARKHDLFVLEDAAHAMGGTYRGKALGTIGHFGGFSLHEVKNINSFGEGGVLLTNLDCGEQFSRARFLGLDFSKKIKNWLYDISPLTDRFGKPQVAGNQSFTEIQAVGLMLQMRRLDRIIAERKKAALHMNSVLSREPGIFIEKADTETTCGTHHLYLLRIDPEVIGGDIQALIKKLTDRGLTCITHFGPMYRFSIMKAFGYDEKAIARTCPVTEELFDRGYTHLPLYPLTPAQLDYQAHAVVEAVREMKQGK